MSSPVDVKVTFVPVLAVNASITFWNLACSSPLHTAATSMDPPTFFNATVGLEELEELDPEPEDLLEPHAAASMRPAHATTSNGLHFFTVILLDRSPTRYQRRTGAAHVCRPPFRCPAPL